MVSDGKSNKERDKEENLIQQLHNRNVSIYAVGVGKFLTNELQNITRNASRVILVDKFEDLSGMVRALTNMVTTDRHGNLLSCILASTAPAIEKTNKIDLNMAMPHYSESLGLEIPFQYDIFIGK